MIGCYDFIGYYDWTFEWLHQKGGEELVRAYWDEAIHCDSQTHARELIVSCGIEGMKAYWAHTLEEEAAGCTVTATERVYRIDMHECPSRGFLLRNGLQHYHDYSDHCMGWIGPLMKEAGFTIDHEHNHRGQCWWEIRRSDDPTPPSAPGELAGENDVRLRSDWDDGTTPIDRYIRANGPDEKQIA